MRQVTYSVFLAVCLALFATLTQANTPPALSSPNASPEAHLGAEYFGNLAGSASVGSGGNASYIIPLELPPGTNSMVPDLSLNYHSDVKNGYLGVGWFVEGLTSKINRCPQTIAQDGQSKGIDLSSDDKFCLDGHRLIAVSGTYGAPGTEYRTESDEFSRITSVGGTAGNPAYWTVERKDGVTLTFGESSTAKMEAPGTSSTVVWCLEKVEDELGNYFEYSFDRPVTVNDAADSYLRTTRIDYTANDSQSLSAYASVQFEYEDRDDDLIKYGLNGPITTDKRISNIKTYVGATLVKDYQLTYEYGTATSQSRLISLKACSNLGACTETTNFTWSDESVDPILTKTIAGAVSYGLKAIGDFNADGYPDVLYGAVTPGGPLSLMHNAQDGSLNTGPSSSALSNLQTHDISTGDFNGDGRSDLFGCSNNLSLSQKCFLLHADSQGAFQSVTEEFFWYHRGGFWYGKPILPVMLMAMVGTTLL